MIGTNLWELASQTLGLLVFTAGAVFASGFVGAIIGLEIIWLIGE